MALRGAWLPAEKPVVAQPGQWSKGMVCAGDAARLRLSAAPGFAKNRNAASRSDPPFHLDQLRVSATTRSRQRQDSVFLPTVTRGYQMHLLHQP